MGRLADNLKDAVKKLAYRTSVDQLKRKGYDKVNVLGIDRITNLIQEAVQRSLRTHLLAVDRQQIASATKDEFMRLLKSNEDLSRQHDELRRLKDAAEEQVDHLRRDIAEQERLLKSKLESAEVEDSVRYTGEDQQIAERLSSLMEDLAETGDSGIAHDHVLALVMDIVRDQRREVLEAREGLRDREVHNLQRRITKLNGALQKTEGRLSQVTAQKNIDDGISSIYREVQGIKDGEADGGHKKSLMANIFEANMRLQKKA